MISRREFLANTSATAMTIAMAPAFQAVALPEMFACEGCLGHGWLNSRSAGYPDCRHCDGSGLMTNDQLHAWWDRYA